MARKIVTRKTSVPVPPDLNVPVAETRPSRKLPWRYILIGLAVLFLILFAANKGWVVAAIVDGRPIFSWELNKTLRARYGQQTLEGMIGEKLIDKEANAAGVRVTEDEIKTKQKEVLSSLGTEVNLDDFLKFQGLTEADFNQQLKIQLTVERLLTKDMKVSETDIDNFIATNRATLTATEPGALRNEARNAIINSAVSEKLQSWFLGIRQKAKIMKFL